VKAILSLCSDSSAARPGIGFCTHERRGKGGRGSRAMWDTAVETAKSRKDRQLTYGGDDYDDDGSLDVSLYH
jgi:hypothetical protein